MNNKNDYDNFIKSQEQLANYFSVEISEFFKECPEEKEIAAIEKVLSTYLKAALAA